MSLGNKNWQMVMVIYLVSLWGCQENNSKNQLELKRRADNMTITHQHSGYTAGPNQWQAFLSCWYKAYQRRYQVLLSESPDYPELPILSKYGLEPAQQQVIGDINEAIDKLEMSLGTTLPKSYKDFLLAYQPPLFEPNVVYGWAAAIGLYAPVQVGRAGILEPELVGIYEEIAEEEMAFRDIETTDEDYFVYGIEQDDATGRTHYLRDAIVVGKYGNDSFALILLYPQVKTADGEMEATILYHAGQFRAPSFAELMRQLSFYETQDITHVPPYSQKLLQGTCADKLPMVNVWWK